MKKATSLLKQVIGQREKSTSEVELHNRMWYCLLAQGVTPGKRKKEGEGKEEGKLDWLWR